jgi:putative transposase
VPVTRPRARIIDGHEVPLPAYRLFAAQDQLTQVVMERMLAGLATRRHIAAAEPVGRDIEAAASATSRSAVSRRFVAQAKTALAQLLARDLSGLDVRVPMIGGGHICDH